MVTVSNILDAVPPHCEPITVDSSQLDREITGPATLGDAGPSNVAYVKHVGSAAAAAAQSLEAGVLVIPASLDIEDQSLPAVLVIRAENPRLTFIQLVSRWFTSRPAPGIHPSAVIAPEAQIDATASVAAGCVIGDATIGPGFVLHAGVHLYDNVRLIENVVVHSGAVLGSDGFGYERDEDGMPVKFPHLGGVVVEPDVEIGANAAIDRGTISDTVIQHDAKIDNLVHIAHNVTIGAGTMVAACAVIAGSTMVGERVWVGPSACISNGLRIGHGAEISLGAVVTKDVAPGTRVSGNFAVPHRTFLRHLSAMDD